MAVAALPRPQHVPVVLLHALRRIAASREGAKMALVHCGSDHGHKVLWLYMVKMVNELIRGGRMTFLVIMIREWEQLIGHPGRRVEDLQGGIHNKGRRPLIIVKILMTMDQLMGNIVVAYGPVLVVIIRIKRRVLRILARGSD
uniref:Uncharacterized protein n=1 Tax=Oryza meridionalis TaxID=40149 RepID=A0A0E0EQJ6_9ORYZ